MLTIQDKLILKRKVYLQNGQQATKTYKLLRYRFKSQSVEIYDVFDSELSQQLTLKIMIKNQQLSKQKSINQIKNQQLFVNLPNFISLYEIYQDTQNIYLVMEKWGDNLADLANQRGTMTQFQAQLIFSQLVDIIVELRKNNVAHNFITLESLYIDVNDKHKIKLGDFKKSFNVASYFQNISPSAKKSFHQNIQKLQKKLKQSHPMLLNLQPKQLHQKFTSYSSPEQVSPSNYTQDYAKFLGSLYQNDIWNIGIIMFRLLLGRFPFDQQDEQDLKFAFDAFTNKNEFQSVNKRQCCFTFYEKGSMYCEPISIQFKQLIKAILKPVNMRIRLKDLLNHPLKLKSYHNVKNINFQHNLPPLMSCNLPQYTSLKPIHLHLFENYILQKQIQQIQQQEKRWNSNAKLFQSNTDNFFQTYQPNNMNEQGGLDNKQTTKSDKKDKKSVNFKQKLENNGLKFLSPSLNYSLFSVFNDDYQNLSTIKNQQLSNTQKYFYLWDINFTHLSEIGSELSINQPISHSQEQPFFMEKQKKSSHQIDSITKKMMNQKLLVVNSGKIPKQINAIDNYQIESQNNAKFSQNEKENGLKNIMTLTKRVPSANSSKRQFFKSVHNTGGTEGFNNFAKTTSSGNQFNIRSFNSKKNINSTVFSNPDRKATFEKKQKNEKSNQMSLKSEQVECFQTKSLTNSRHLNSKANSYSCNMNSDSKPSFKKYKQNDEIYEVQQTYNNFNSNFNGTKMQNKALTALQINQQREAQLLILKNYVQKVPLLVEQPQFILQYRFNKQENSLGYVINNAVGVIFGNGKHVMGHNQNDFVMLNKDTNSSPTKYSAFQVQKISKSLSLKNLTSSQMQIYHNFLKLFGKRMVISNFQIWIQKYWRMGRIYIFLFNNGCWQVTFEGKKTAKFFVIDENQFIWLKGNIKPEIRNQVRNIVCQKKKELLQEQYFFK